MAVKSGMARPTKRGLKKTAVTLLFITSLGWLTLFTWAMWLWTREGFESACIAVHRVSILQMQTISAFEDASLLTRLHTSLLPALKENTRDINRQMKDAQQAIRDKAIEQWQAHVGSRRIEGEDVLGKSMQDLRLHAAQCWYLFCATGRALGIKLAILLASLPLFLWASVAGLVDGLNQRAIRTACLGRESTYVFHKSIPMVKGCMAVILSLWLSVPMVLPPSVIFVSLAILVSIAVSVSASRFKKYI